MLKKQITILIFNYLKLEIKKKKFFIFETKTKK